MLYKGALVAGVAPDLPLVRLLQEHISAAGSKTAVAKDLGITRPTLDRWLRGERPDRGQAIRQRVAERLGITRDDFDRLCGDEPADTNVIQLLSLAGDGGAADLESTSLVELRSEFMRSVNVALRTPGLGDSAIWAANAGRAGRTLGLSEWAD